MFFNVFIPIYILYKKAKIKRISIEYGREYIKIC